MVETELNAERNWAQGLAQQMTPAQRGEYESLQRANDGLMKVCVEGEGSRNGEGERGGDIFLGTPSQRPRGCDVGQGLV